MQQDDERIIQEIQKEGEEELNKKTGGGSRNASRPDANLLFLTCRGVEVAGGPQTGDT